MGGVGPPHLPAIVGLVTHLQAKECPGVGPDVDTPATTAGWNTIGSPIGTLQSDAPDSADRQWTSP